MNISSGALLGPGRERERLRRRDKDRERERERERHTAELFGPNRRQPRERVPCKFVPDWEQGKKAWREGESWTTVEGARRHRSKRLEAREEAVDD